MRRTERAAYRTKFYSNLSSPTQFDEEPFFIHKHFFKNQAAKSLLKDFLQLFYFFHR